MKGFVKLMRDGAIYDLLAKDIEAYALLTLLALRARRSDGANLDGLQPGEALMGDHAACGLTRREYRTRLKRLEKAGLLTSKTTSKGTVAKLINTEVFDINVENTASKTTNERPASGQQEANRRPLTRMEEGNNKEGEELQREIDIKGSETSNGIHDDQDGKNPQGGAQEDGGGNTNGSQTPRFISPTLEEVKGFAQTFTTPEVAEAFWNAKESVGWRDRFGNPIVKWRPAFKAYAAAVRSSEGQRAQQGRVNGSNQPRKKTEYDF